MQSKADMQSIPILGGSRGMLSKKIFQKMYSEIESGTFWDKKLS